MNLNRGEKGERGSRGRRGRTGKSGLSAGLFIAAVTFAAVLSFLVARGVQLQAQTAQARDQIARQQEQLEEAKQTHRVLCSLKDANHHSVIDGRVALKRSRQILKDNPNGITFGSTHFSHAQLVQSVRTQEATQKRTERAAAAYAGLKHCPKP